jgi:hypothetical protein
MTEINDELSGRVLGIGIAAVINNNRRAIEINMRNCRVPNAVGVCREDSMFVLWTLNNDLTPVIMRLKIEKRWLPIFWSYVVERVRVNIVRNPWRQNYRLCFIAGGRLFIGFSIARGRLFIRLTIIWLG